MTWDLRDWPGPADAELDAWMSRTWEAAAAAVGTMLDIPAGQEALLARSGLVAEGSADLRAPSVTTRRVERRWRRRPLTLGAAGLATALVVGAVALVAVGIPGEGHGSTQPPVVNTAYVLNRVDGALSTAAPSALAQMTVTTAGPGVMTTTEVWSYGDQWRTVTSSSAGRPAYDQGFSSGSVYTLVSYLMRAWADRHIPGAAGFGPGGCESGLAVLSLPGPFGRLHVNVQPATVVKDLRAAISCGALTMAGRQRVNGVETIKLTSRASSPFPETIWASPSTYLPVRVVALPDFGGSVFRQTANITWLKPTAQNQAELTVPIPAGFRHISLAPILRQLRKRTWG
jgi:hypothetical protein